MKIGRDGKFDKLKKMRCEQKPKNAPLRYFLTGVLGSRPLKAMS